MRGLLGSGVAVMIVANAVIGLRLLLLASRSRRLPELGIGASLLLLGAIGYPLSILARNGAAGSPDADARLLAAAIACQNLGCAAMALATVATFRSGVRWARGLALLLASLGVGSWIAQVATGDFHRASGASEAYWLGFAARALPYLWAAAESWRYHGLLRRRLAIGLSDAVVTDRFRLWAISTSSVVGAFAIFLIALLCGAEVARTPWVLAPTSLVGCISGVTLWLAFLPPAGYLRRFGVGRDSAPSGDPS